MKKVVVFEKKFEKKEKKKFLIDVWIAEWTLEDGDYEGRGLRPDTGTGQFWEDGMANDCISVVIVTV